MFCFTYVSKGKMMKVSAAVLEVEAEMISLFSN